MKTIFDSFELGNLKLKNRLIRSATWVALADEEGNLTGTLVDTYRELAKGGVAAIITGITTVSPHDAYLDGLFNFMMTNSSSSIHRHDPRIRLQNLYADRNG